MEEKIYYKLGGKSYIFWFLKMAHTHKGNLEGVSLGPHQLKAGFNSKGESREISMPFINQL
jgi:hypothetical protein